MIYRTRTYIAGDWTGDKDLIDTLYRWNNSDFWGLSFSDAHELTQARDTSLPCTIKRSLKERLDSSKRFVLVVGSNTDGLTKGSCRYCPSYSSYSGCNRGHSSDQKSFIDYECQYAARNNLEVIVLYNYLAVDRPKCPEAVRHTGNHLPARYRGSDGKHYWDYNAIRRALGC